MIDADTVVDPFSLNYLVGSFVQDKKGELSCLSSELVMFPLTFDLARQSSDFAGRRRSRMPKLLGPL